MSDPAVEAARRAWDKSNTSGLRKSWDQLEGNTFTQMQIDAANEALAPIRKLHRPAPSDDLCIVCCYWPCATARLIYTTEELNDEQ